jgi:hypothetical protein
MKKTVGGIDKGVRIVIGFALILDGIFIPMTTGWRVAAFIVAGISLITAFSGLCPLYSVLGISTRKEIY